MKKLFWTLLAVATLTVGFVGCKDKDKPNDPFNKKDKDTVAALTIDTTKAITCAEAKTKALEGKTDAVVVKGYVTGLVGKTSHKNGGLTKSVWLADDATATKGVIQAYYLEITDSIEKGDYVAAEGKLAKYQKNSESEIVAEITNGKMEIIRKGAGGTSGGGGADPNYTPTGAGTQTNPYTIADVIGMNIQDAEGSGTMAWIKGYIVGCVKSGATKLSATNWEHSSFTGTTNLIVADDADETAIANCTAIQLKTGDILQQQLNLPGNSGNYKKELLIYGELCKYFGVAGLKKPSKAYLDGTEIKEKELTGIWTETLLTQASFNKFEIFDELGDSTWRFSVRKNNSNQLIYDGAKMSGYNDADEVTEANKDWFISPAIDLSALSSATLQFESARGPAGSMNYSTTGLRVYVSNEYETGEDPTDYDWTQITPVAHGTGAWAYVTSTITIPNANLDENFHFAFYYECDDSESATWEIKNVAIQGE